MRPARSCSRISSEQTALSRDYFIRVIYGTRVSLSVGVVASIMVLIIGLLYGSIAGYFGGKVDLIMMRIVDIIYSLPDMLIIILLSVVFNETLKTAHYRNGAGKAGNEHDLHVHRIRTSVLGKYGASDPRPDPFH